MRNLVGGEPAMFLPSLEAENGAPKVNGWPGHALPMCLDLVGEGSMGGPSEVHEMTGQPP